MIALKKGRGSFADVLIGALGAKAGLLRHCDLRSKGAAASRVPAAIALSCAGNPV